MVNILPMQEDNKSPDNSQNQAFTGKTLIAGGGGAIIGSIASWASVNAINDFFSKNLKNLAHEAAEIRLSPNYKNDDDLRKSFEAANNALDKAKDKLTNPEAIAIATAVFLGVSVLTGWAIHTLLPDKKIDPATVEKQGVVTAEELFLAKDKVAKL